MRAFFAIPLPETAVSALEDLQADMPFGRPVPSENLHLTLAFLGELPDHAVEAAHEAAGQINRAAFTLELAGLGTIGGRTPALVHIGVTPNPDLADLHRRIRSRLHGAGLMLPRERFMPHVTLARFGKRLSPTDTARLGGLLANHALLRLSPFPVHHFSLFRSTLGPDGAVYEELARYSLN